jgi:hypothetical protein
MPVSLTGLSEPGPTADGDPQHVLQGLRGPREREPHGPLTGPTVGEHGPRPTEHAPTLLRRAGGSTVAYLEGGSSGELIDEPEGALRHEAEPLVRLEPLRV